MKLSKIGALCKAYKRFVVYNVSHGMQWISDGYAAYPLYDLPPLEEDNVYAIFDIPEDKRGKMSFVEHKGVPSGMSFADAVADEVEIKPYSIGIIWHGAVYYPCKSREGVLFIDKKYLAPFEDGAVLYERWAENGVPYIVAKRGMLLEGIITPAGIATAELADLLCEVGNLTAAVSEGGNGDDAAEAEQEAMDV